MIWNALKAGEVKYEYTLVSENGTLVSKTTLVDKKDGNTANNLTMLKDKYNITIVEEDDILTRVVEDDKGTYTVYTTKNTKGYTKVAKDFSDLMGQKVDILIKDVGTSNEKVFGIYADEDSAVVATGVIGDLDKASDSGKIKFNSTEYKIENSAANTRYTKVVKFNQNEEYTANSLKALSDSHAGAQQAYAIKLIDNDGNGKIDYAVVTPFTFAKVTYAGTKSVTAGSSYTFEDCNIYKDIAKDDYVAIYAKVNTVADKDTLVKAQTVSGEVGGTKGSNPITDIQVGTTWYKTAANLSINVDSSYDFAVVNGYIFASDVTAEASKDILFLSARDTLDATLSDTGTIEAKVFIGNKDRIVKIEKLEGKKITASSNTTDINSGKYADQASVTMGLYTYTVNSAGNYEIKALSDTSNKAGYDTYNSNAGKFANTTDKIGSYSIADDAVVYGQKSNTLTTGATVKDAKCITGKQLKSWSKDYGDKLSQVLVTKTNGIEYAKVVALIDAEVPASSTSDLMYAYVVDDANNGPYVGKNSENDTVTWMTLWTGSKEIKVYTKDANTLEKGDAISYKEVSSDEIDTITKLETYVAITGVETKKEGQVVYQQAASGTTTSNSYKQDEDIVVIGIDSENSKGAELKIDGIATAQSKADGTYVPNAILAVDTSAQKVLAIFADIGNELDGKSSIDSAATSDIKAVAKEIQDKLTKVGNSYTLNASSADIVTGLTVNTMKKATVKCTVADAGTTNIAAVNYASGKLTATTADASKTLASGTAKVKVEVSKDDGATITFDVTVNLTIS